MNILFSAERNRRLDALFIGILIVVSGMLHAFYQFGSLYGEHDSARFMVDGVIWAKAGIRSIALSEYRYFVSPAYIFLAKLAYGWGSSTGVHPQLILDVITNVCAVLCFVPAYLLFANLLGSGSAFVACLYLEIVPAFWFSSLYGFPTVIGMLFVLLALFLWDEFLLERVILKPPFHLALVFLAALAGTCMKADMLTLSAPAFVGLVLIRRGLAWRTMLLAVGLVSMAIVVGYGIGHSLVQDSAHAAEYAKEWNREFDPGNAKGVGVDHMNYIDELRLYVMSMGMLTIPAVVLAMALMVWNKQRAFAVAIAIWLPMTFLFWAWRPGDGSRHHVPAAVPAALAIGYLFAIASRSRLRYPLYGFLCLVVLVNTFRYPASAISAIPSGRLLRSARMVEEDAARVQKKADTYIEGNCRAVLLGSPLTPYAEATLVLKAPQFTVKPEKLEGYLVREFDYDRGDSQCQSLNVRILSAAGADRAARIFRSEGKNVRSYEYALPE